MSMGRQELMSFSDSKNIISVSANTMRKNFTRSQAGTRLPHLNSRVAAGIMHREVVVDIRAAVVVADVHVAVAADAGAKNRLFASTT